MAKKTIANPVIKELLLRYKTLWALSHVSALAGWDVETYMPEKGSRARGEALAMLSSLSQKLFLDKKFVSLIRQAQKESRLSDQERGIVRVLSRQLSYYQKIPAEFVENMERLTSQAQVAWRNSRSKNDYSIFEPYFKKIIAVNRKKAEYLGYKEHPYDALLDLFEEGLTTRDVEHFFSNVKPALQEILAQVMKKRKNNANHPLDELPYDQARMAELNERVLEYFKTDRGRLRLDVSAHPFSESLALQDSRITTTYHKKGFKKTLSSVVHEFGHALYDLQCDPSLEYTPIQGGSSLVVHESQSRFWENLVGRNKTFLLHFADQVKQLSPEISAYLKGKNVGEELFAYFNAVRPGLIRIEADEITYHFHIILRFEIEKGLMEGSFKPKDIPEIWDSKMRQYLGIKPSSYANGFLQDIHWSMGSIGYFPTYSLGTFLSAMWLKAMEKSLGTSLEMLLEEKDGIDKIRHWMKENIHKHGSTYTVKELLRRSLGTDFLFEPMLEYLRKKYL